MRVNKTMSGILVHMLANAIRNLRFIGEYLKDCECRYWWFSSCMWWDRGYIKKHSNQS